MNDIRPQVQEGDRLDQIQPLKMIALTVEIPSTLLTKGEATVRIPKDSVVRQIWHTREGKTLAIITCRVHNEAPEVPVMESNVEKRFYVSQDGRYNLADIYVGTIFEYTDKGHIISTHVIQAHH